MKLLTHMLSLLAAVGVVGFVVLGFIAFGDADLAGCTPHTGGRRIRVIGSYLCSPHLLRGGPREWFAFIWLWSFPAAAVGFSFFAWRHQRRDAITL